MFSFLNSLKYAKNTPKFLIFLHLKKTVKHCTQKKSKQQQQQKWMSNKKNPDVFKTIWNSPKNPEVSICLPKKSGGSQKRSQHPQRKIRTYNNNKIWTYNAYIVSNRFLGPIDFFYDVWIFLVLRLIFCCHMCFKCHKMGIKLNILSVLLHPSHIVYNYIAEKYPPGPASFCPAWLTQ